LEKIKTDLLLKHLFKNPATKLIEIILGKKINWQLLQDTDLKIVKNREADLVVKLEDNTILHIEIQSTNDPSMPYRMFEYFYLITDKYKPKDLIQVCIYLGKEPLKMSDKIQFSDWTYRYRLIDMKDVPCRELAKSPNITDKLLAGLCKIEDPKFYVENVIKEIKKANPKDRKELFTLFLEISKIRNNIEEEIKMYIRQEDFEMPITIEWTWEELESYPGIGKALKTGKEKFIKEGLQQGLQQGLKDSILEILELKFGVLPEDVKAKINSTDDIEVLKEMRKKAILIQSLDEF
jgi:predicted transposase YdaD